MYTIKFTCKALTGRKVHTIVVDDSSLEDTWLGVDLGEIKGMEKVREVSGYTHDANPYIGEDDDGREIVELSVYAYYIDENGNVQTEHDNWTQCKIMEIICDGTGEQYTKKGYVRTRKAPKKKEKSFNVYYNDSGESRSGLAEYTAVDEDHVRAMFYRDYPDYVIIDEIEEA